MLGGYNHRRFLAGGRSKRIELRVAVRRGWPNRMRPNNIAALHQIASQFQFRDRGLCQDAYDAHLPDVSVHGSHCMAQLVLPLEPLVILQGIALRANDFEFVPDLYAL